MANSTVANPWFLDTAPFLWNYSNVYVKNIVWSNFVVGSVVLLEDQNSNIILSATIETTDTDLGPRSFSGFGWVRGLKLVTLSGGNLSIGITKA